MSTRAAAESAAGEHGTAKPRNTPGAHAFSLRGIEADDTPTCSIPCTPASFANFSLDFRFMFVYNRDYL